jgi:hypothetical protein
MPGSFRIGCQGPDHGAGGRIGAYPDVPRLNDIIAAWGAGNALPGWAKSARRSANQWSFPGFFIQSARHDPKIVFARHDHAYDEVQEL